MIVGNPAELVEIDHRSMTIEQKEVRHHPPLTEEEYQLALSKLGRPHRDWVVLGYCCGLRLGDAVCLEFDSFTAEHIIVWPSKSKKAKRLALPLNDPLIARPELLELIADLLGRRGEDALYVWPDDQEQFLTPQRNHYTKVFGRKFAAIGINDRTFHGLRVSFARRLQAAGKTIYDVAKAMGHDSTSTTAIYIGDS
jgi:integrase